MVTNAQRLLIESMNEVCNEKFDLSKGTKLSASQYISRNIEMFKLLTTDDYLLENGYF